MRKAMIVVGCVAVLCAALPALGQGGDKAEAQKHFQAGLALFKAEKYEAAVIELELSVKLFPTKGGLFNLANVYRVLMRYDDTLAAIDRLEREYGDRLDAEMQSAASKMKTEIKNLTAQLDLQVSPDGAMILVDGREVGTAPLARPLSVDPGKHLVRAELDGLAPQEVEVQVLARQVEKIALSLQAKSGGGAVVAAVDTAKHAEPGPEATPGETGETAASGSEDGGRKKIGLAPLIVAGAVAVAAGGATIALGVVSGKKRDSAMANADQGELDGAKKLQTAGRATFGVALGAAAAAIVLAFFTDFHKEEAVATETTAARGLELEGVWPVAIEDGAGAAFGGRF